MHFRRFTAIISLFSFCFMLLVSACADVEGAMEVFMPEWEPIGLGQVWILDAGHGGADGGAVSVTGKIESELNLEITLRLRDLLMLFGCRTHLTRDSEELSYPPEADTIRQKKIYDSRNRVALVENIPDGIFLSIHQNTYTTPQPSGIHVFYAPTNGSQELGESFQSTLNQVVDTEHEHSARQISSDIYIMNNISCPGILVECGFLSNPEEAAKLETAEHQKRLAAAIGAVCIRFSYQGEMTSESQNHIFLHRVRQRVSQMARTMSVL